MDAVESQVNAYNTHDGEGNELVRGRADMRERYGRLFSESRSVRAEILNRIRVGRYVIDEERVTGRSDGDFHAAVVYRLDDDGLIDRVLFLR